MTRISFLGLGAMGSRMATRLIEAGHQVTVWNRTQTATEALVKLGATAAPHPAAAAEGAEVVIAMVRDDNASRFVWLDPEHGALPVMEEDAIAIDCSTLSLDWVKTLSAECAKKNIGFLDAPVAGSRPQAEAGQLIFFVGGNQSDLDKALPLLEAMGGRVSLLGDNGAGAVAKLATNALLALQVAGLAEILPMIKGFNGNTQAIMDSVLTTPVGSPFAHLITNMMLNEQFQPLFPIELVRKDCAYMLQSTEQFQVDSALFDEVHNRFKSAEENGLGQENMTALIKNRQS